MIQIAKDQIVYWFFVVLLALTLALSALTLVSTTGSGLCGQAFGERLECRDGWGSVRFTGRRHAGRVGRHGRLRPRQQHGLLSLVRDRADRLL